MIRKFRWEEIKEEFEFNKAFLKQIRKIVEAFMKLNMSREEKEELGKKMIEKALDIGESKDRPDKFTPFQLVSIFTRYGKTDKRLAILKFFSNSLSIKFPSILSSETNANIYIPGRQMNIWMYAGDKLSKEEKEEVIKKQWELMKNLLQINHWREINEEDKRFMENWKSVKGNFLTFILYLIRPDVFFPVSDPFQKNLFWKLYKETIEFKVNERYFHNYWKFLDWFYPRRNKLIETFISDFPFGKIREEDHNIALNIAIQKNVEDEKGDGGKGKTTTILKNAQPETSEEESPKDNPENLLSYLQSRGFLINEIDLNALWNALRVKGFVLLAGLTGSGKSQIAQLLAELASEKEEQFKFISVKPNWMDSSELLGWENPIKDRENKFIPGEVSDLLANLAGEAEGNQKPEKPYFIILDEMNLSHIEYYFAEFLSVLESGRDDKRKNKGRTKGTIKYYKKGAEEPGKLNLPPNLYIIGTLNTDETTKSLSPKVLDRSFVIEFWEVDMENYPPDNEFQEEERKKKNVEKKLKEKSLTELQHPFEVSTFLSHWGNKEIVNKLVRKFNEGEDKEGEDKEKFKKLWEDLKDLKDRLKNYNLHFGYRVIDEISLFVLAAEKSEIAHLDAKVAFDIAIKAKVLPKFFGTPAKLEEPLLEVLAWSLKEENKKTEVIKELKDNFQDFIIANGKLTTKKNLESEKRQAEKANEESVEEVEEKEKEKEKEIKEYPLKYPITAEKALSMLKRLHSEGFTSYF